MKKYFKKNQKISVVPSNIKGASNTKISTMNTSDFEVKISDNDIQYFTEGEGIEIFTIIDAGILYLKSLILSVDFENKIIKIAYDKEKQEILQRREYTRVDFAKEFTLTDTVTKEAFVCTGIDISAGGIKLVTTAHLNTSCDYQIEFTLENSIPIKCFFRPIRVLAEKGKKTQNTVSGKFVALKNIDKIAIVQYCFKKNMEFTNK